jgi:hypothetical protein
MLAPLSVYLTPGFLVWSVVIIGDIAPIPPSCIEKVLYYDAVGALVKAASLAITQYRLFGFSAFLSYVQCKRIGRLLRLVIFIRITSLEAQTPD